jgi:hypothetical protein
MFTFRDVAISSPAITDYAVGSIPRSRLGGVATMYFGGRLETVVIATVESSHAAVFVTTAPPRRRLGNPPVWQRLHELESGEGWDPSKGERPNAVALTHARNVLEALVAASLEPARLIASDRSVVLYISGGSKYATVRSLNDGTLVAVTSDGINMPKAWTVKLDKISETVARIRAYLA